MKSVAEQFLDQLKAGNINEAIDVIKSGLHDEIATEFKSIEEGVLETFGFVVEKGDKEMKEQDDDYEDDEDDSDDDEDDSEDDESDEKEDKKKDEE